MKSKSTALLLSAALVSTSLSFSAPANAQTVRGLEDLIGARGSSLDGELARRGYKFTKNRGAASMYWNGPRSSCISALVENGRVESIQRAAAAYCDQDAGKQLVGVAVGAAAAGLIAALTAHHHGQDHRNNNQRYNRQFQRGYDDATNGSGYSLHDSDAYHAGYVAGEAERRNQGPSNNRPGYGGNRPGYGGGGGQVSIADIRGMNAIRAIDVMTSRGFAGVDTITSGNTLYHIYYLRRTGQCVQMTTANNRVTDIRDIGRHPKCRPGGGGGGGGGSYEPPASSNAAKVQFPPGRSSVKLEGAVVGRTDFDYSLRANAGQMMIVNLRVDGTNGNGTIYFNILPPGSRGEAIFVGSRDGNTARVRLPRSGDYVIRLYLMGNDRDTDKTVGYDLNVAIR